MTCVVSSRDAEAVLPLRSINRKTARAIFETDLVPDGNENASSDDDLRSDSTFMTEDAESHSFLLLPTFALDIDTGPHESDSDEMPLLIPRQRLWVDEDSDSDTDFRPSLLSNSDTSDNDELPVLGATDFGHNNFPEFEYWPRTAQFFSAAVSASPASAVPAASASPASDLFAVSTPSSSVAAVANTTSAQHRHHDQTRTIFVDADSTWYPSNSVTAVTAANRFVVRFRDQPQPRRSPDEAALSAALSLLRSLPPAQCHVTREPFDSDSDDDSDPEALPAIYRESPGTRPVLSARTPTSTSAPSSTTPPATTSCPSEFAERFLQQIILSAN
mmetsp:Transcript_16393/g.43949  ORF Transcript_16393/g.43949 Transcript_16393/m.43949 type:complete len:331 (+) Transcript_16393:2145-3137(+)